jgi:hypothetical protein
MILRHFADNIAKLSFEQPNAIDEMSLIKTLQVMIIFLNPTATYNDKLLKSSIDTCHYLNLNKSSSVKNTVAVVMKQIVRFVDEMKAPQCVMTTLHHLNGYLTADKIHVSFQMICLDAIYQILLVYSQVEENEEIDHLTNTQI